MTTPTSNQIYKAMMIAKTLRDKTEYERLHKLYHEMMISVGQQIVKTSLANMTEAERHQLLD